jgi:predicted homoserine dehydrogenase-like protein
MIKQKLLKRHAAGTPIRVGWVGAGRMNTGAICQTALMKGMSNAVICDIRLDAAQRAYELNGWKRKDILITDSAGTANDAIRHGKPVVTQNARLLPDLEIDCVVEGTGVPEVGADVALRCIHAGKHIIMLNVETDVVIGPILHRMAERAGVIYSVSSGDEPGLITELVDRWGGLGFEIAAVGKTPPTLAKLDRYCTPGTVAEDAKALGINPHFLVTFRDASKTSIEMASISNATGLVPDIRGMHGPVAGIQEMARVFCLKEHGGLLNRLGVVDYARPLLLPDGSIDFVNSVTPGVFVVVHVTHPQIREDLQYLRVVGDGDYFTFYTPYHLVTNEMPLSIVWAVEDHEPTVVPYHGLLTECLGAAKADLKAGTLLDGGGGYTVYSVNDLACIAKRENCVPFGLLDEAKLLKDVKRDQILTYDLVQLRSDTTLYHLRKLQDTMIPPTERECN